MKQGNKQAESANYQKVKVSEWEMESQEDEWNPKKMRKGIPRIWWLLLKKKQNKDIGITNPEDLKLKKVIMKDGS